MGYFKPSSYTIENALREAARYEGIYVGDNYVTKDHGNYIEVCIDADNRKHCSDIKEIFASAELVKLSA